MNTIKKFVKSHTTSGFRTAARNLFNEFRIQHVHFSTVRHFKREFPRKYGKQLRINLGCGGITRNGWTNVDLAGQADLQLDLREPFPFGDQTASIIYSEHFLEHLEYPTEALNVLKESLRVLVPGGIFSVGVPDTERALKNYIERDPVLFQRLMKSGWYPSWCDSWMHQVNCHFRQGKEHKYAYDYETLARILANVGFTNVKRREFNPSLDSVERKSGTLYVDAVKP